MARYKASLDTPRPPDEVFAYLSDFSTTAEWDPGVVEAERLGDPPIAEGSEFWLVADFLHRKTTLTYSIIEYDPPGRERLFGSPQSACKRDPPGTRAATRPPC